MRKFLIGLVVLLLVLVAAAFVGPRFIPADALKADIAQQVRAATGRELAIDGDLSFTLLPAPGVAVSGVRLSNADGAHSDDMLRLRSAQVAVALGPLLGGKIEIDRVVLVEPVLELEQLPGGANNWTFSALDATVDETESGAQDDDSARGGIAGSVQLNDLVVRDGVVVFRTPDHSERIDGINGSFAAGSLSGPFRAEADVVLRGMATSVRVSVGELATDRAVPLGLTIGVEGGETTFSGILAGFPGEPRLSGELAVRADNLAALSESLAGARPGPVPPVALALKGDVAANRDAAALNNLSLQLGELGATGAVNVALGETPSIDIIVNAGQFDLDKALADLRASAGQADDRSASAGGDAESAAAAGFALPRGINGSVEARIDIVRYRGGVLRQAALNAQLADGELTVSQLTAQLPGSADVSLFGFVTARDGVPAFGGQVEANADDLRGLLSWLGVDAAGVPLDRLRQLALSAKVDGTPDKIDITDIDLGLDGSRIRGGVAAALRPRLGLGIGLSVDTLNIDAYLPSAAPAPDGAGRTAPQPEAARPLDLAFLGSFDSILRLKADSLTFRGKSLRGVSIDGTLADGSLELRDASIQSLAGARTRAAGRVAELAGGAPSVDLNLEVESQESDRLLELLGAAPAFTVGPGRLVGAVKGTLDKLELDATLAALDGEAKTRGKILGLPGEAEFDLSFDLSHGDAAQLLSRFNGAGKAAKPAPAGPLRIAAAATGSLAKSAFSARVTVGGASLMTRGQLSGVGTAQMSGNATVTGEHADMAAAVRMFAPDYRPALSEPGPLKFSTDLAFDPTTLRIDNMRGNAGPVAFESTANLALDSAVPRVTGELKTSEIIVDWFLPVRAAAARADKQPSGRAGGAARQGAGRWSDEPIDVAALRRFDAAIDLVAPSISYTDMRVDQPKASFSLSDGVLDLRELSGRAYGGTFNMTAQLAARKVPSLRYALNLAGADAAQFTGAAGQQSRGLMSVLDLLFPVSSVKLASGRLNANVDVASQGRSERELIGALAGNGQVSFTDAVAEGVDLCRISNQLGNLNGLEGFLGLVLSAQGGATRIANYDGRFDIKNGIANLPRQRITADCATVDFAGTVDLPRWLVDIQAKALFPEHPKFPGVIVEEKGPLDAPNTRLVNSNEVQQYIIGRSAGSVLRKIAPELEQAPASPGGTSSQPAPQPSDQIRGLLRDLLKDR